MKTKLLLTGLAIIAITSFVSAQDPVPGQGQRNGNCRYNGKGRGVAFVDANKDGICDNIGNGSNASGQKGRGNGTCYGNGNGKGQGQGKGKGRNFIDANQNGICDKFEAQTRK
jgi:hypothetical protein